MSFIRPVAPLTFLSFTNLTATVLTFPQIRFALYFSLKPSTPKRPLLLFDGLQSAFGGKLDGFSLAVALSSSGILLWAAGAWQSVRSL